MSHPATIMCIDTRYLLISRSEKFQFGDSSSPVMCKQILVPKNLFYHPKFFCHLVFKNFLPPTLQKMLPPHLKFFPTPLPNFFWPPHCQKILPPHSKKFLHPLQIFFCHPSTFLSFPSLAFNLTSLLLVICFAHAKNYQKRTQFLKF